MYEALQQRLKSWKGKSSGWQLEKQLSAATYDGLRREVIAAFQAYVRQHRDCRHIIPVSKFDAASFGIVQTPLTPRMWSDMHPDDAPGRISQAEANAEVMVPCYQLSLLLEPEELGRLGLDEERLRKGSSVIPHLPQTVRMHLALLKLADHVGMGWPEWVMLKNEDWEKVREKWVEEGSGHWSDVITASQSRGSYG